MKKRFNLADIIFTGILCLGILIMTYPIISNIINTEKYSKIIDNYDNNIEKYNDSYLEEAHLYNKYLSNNKIFDIFTQPSFPISSEYNDILKFNDDGIMGYIEIPKINIELPIYHGVGEEVLSKGVGHLEGTSFPVGGSGTHAVLSAHRGLPASKLFTDLDKMEIGDIFYIHILDEVLVYKVDDVLIVKADEVSDIELDGDYDYVTLLTCTPYAINTHRLLVTGKRIEYSGELEYSKGSIKIFTYDMIFYIVIDLLLVRLLYSKIKKKKTKIVFERIK